MFVANVWRRCNMKNKIDKEFDEKFFINNGELTPAAYLDIKQFLHEKINEVLDEAISELVKSGAEKQSDEYMQFMDLLIKLKI